MLVDRLNLLPFLTPKLGLGYALHPLNVDADVLEMAKYVERLIVVESVDHIDGLDEILGDYANTKEEITRKQMIVHVGFKEVEVDADNESEEESDMEENDINGIDSEDLDYDPKHDEVFDDDEHIVKDVPVIMNNFNFIPYPKHGLNISGVKVPYHDLDIVDYDSYGNDLDGGIDSERRIQLRELKRICKQKNKDTMADMNMPVNDVPAEQAPAIALPTRTDDPILPIREWVHVDKSNYVLDVLKSQRNPIFKEEFVQSIQISPTDKKRLTMASHEHDMEEEGAVLESHAPEATKVTKPSAPTTTKVTKPTGDKASRPKSTSSQPPKPKPASTKPLKIVPEKKQKLVKVTPNEPSPAKRSKAGLVGKRRKPKSPLKLLDEFADEDLEARNQGHARLVVFGEPDSERFQPLPEVQGKDTKINVRVQDEGQAGSNSGKQDKGQVGSNPGNAAKLQPQPSHVVNVGLNLEPMDLAVSDSSTQQNPEQMDGEFTTTTYPNVQDNLKLPTEDQSVPPMTTLVLDLPTSQSDSPTVNAPHLTSTTRTTIITTTITLPPPPQPQQSTTDLTLLQRIDNSYEAHDDHKNLYEALQKSLDHDYLNQLLADLDEARRKKRMKHNLPRTPSGAPSLSKSAASTPQSMAWTTFDIRYESAGFAATHETSPTYYLTNDDSIPDEQMEECHKMLTDQITWVNPESDQVRIDVSRPLPLGGPPGHVTIQTQFFFNKDLDHLRYGNKGSRPALSISKMKAAHYPDFGLELLVPEQMWIDEVCTYDISAAYGISRWWFNRKKFYIERHDSPSHRREVRTHMQILSVVKIKAFSRYGYDYLSEIVRQRADFQEHKIAEKDFKNPYPSDFEDLNLLLLQGYLDHLSCFDKLVFLVNKNERKIMRFNEMYKFSDGTLTRILEVLDYRVKEYRVNRLNSGMNTQFWTDKDVTRSKEFIYAIEQRLKTRRIFCNLECFVGGRNWRDLPRDNPLVSIEVLGYDIKRSKCENKGIVPTEMELELEQTQQGSSHEVSNIRVIPKYHSEDGNPARANIKQALGRSDTYTGNPVKEILFKIEST
nr:hypothetical protein [Tanacetum cinerariifolium]